MTLEVSNLQSGRKSAPVPAKVRFVRLPGNPRELYSVGVELEAPANIWGVESVPEDWLSYLDRASVVADTIRGVGFAPETQTEAESEQVKRVPKRSNELTVSAMALSPLESACSQPRPCKTEKPTTTRDGPNRATEMRLRQAAEHAGTSAKSFHTNTAVKEVRATGMAQKERVLKVEGGVRDCDTILVPARVGFLSRLNDELTNAVEHLSEQVAAFLSRTQTIPQSLGVGNGAPETKPAPANAKASSKKLVSGHVSVRAGRDVRYWIKIDTSEMIEPAVTGWFHASGGSTSDIALVLATEHEFDNLIHGREARVLFAVDSIKAGEFHVSIRRSGTYVLALNNRFSIFMPRSFAANIDLRYSTP
jgi:hypothetical protein